MTTNKAQYKCYRFTSTMRSSKYACEVKSCITNPELPETNIYKMFSHLDDKHKIRPKLEKKHFNKKVCLCILQLFL